ncbi:MAG TPA: M1 family aminopeptidase, partial [Bacteroidia bacterium]
HELFHHWFGDLVTCESWANLPLNESFATYGEYLWDEYKYGRDQADVALEAFGSTYKFSNQYSSVSMIRFDYEKQEDMFDANSYHKGGAVLHMLRKHVGDEAFFASLKMYLNRFKFSTAELSDLRKCFEEVTGEDLNWFFNQWFITKDFPVLKVTREVVGKDMKITVVQTADFFRLSLDIDVIDQSGKKRHRLMVEEDSQTFIIPLAANKALIFDAENQLLCEKQMLNSEEIWKNQYKYAELTQHRIEAFSNLLEMLKTADEKNKLCMEMLNHSFYKCRTAALTQMQNMDISLMNAELLEKVKTLALTDPKSEVRVNCSIFLGKQKSTETLVKMLSDSSYDVVEQAFHKLLELDQAEAYRLANSYRNTNDDRMMKIAAVIIAISSQNDEVEYFHNIIRTRSSKNMNAIAWVLANYFEKTSHSVQIDKFVNGLRDMLEDKSNNRARENAKKTVKTLLYALEQYNGYYNYLIKENPKLKKAYTEILSNHEKLKLKLSELKIED